MFHVKRHQIWEQCAHWAGVELSEMMRIHLDRYREWLLAEALPAGGLGPGESDRLEDRHIGDSILFARFVGRSPRVWDLGSGVGLPGIPLAILLPETEMILVDRSGRRVGLCRRALRILELENVEVIQAEIEDLKPRLSMIVSRATLPPEEMRRVAERLLSPGGTALIGGSWTARPSYPGWETISVPATVLDREVWLLMMRQP